MKKKHKRGPREFCLEKIEMGLMTFSTSLWGCNHACAGKGARIEMVVERRAEACTGYVSLVRLRVRRSSKAQFSDTEYGCNMNDEFRCAAVTQLRLGKDNGTKRVSGLVSHRSQLMIVSASQAWLSFQKAKQVCPVKSL